MTWGSSCPVCGQDKCSWTHGRFCEGRVTALEAKLAEQAASAADTIASLRAQIEHDTLRERRFLWFVARWADDQKLSDGEKINIIANHPSVKAERKNGAPSDCASCASLRAQIAELERERDAAVHARQNAFQVCSDVREAIGAHGCPFPALADTAARLRASHAELVEALEPFAKAADRHDLMAHFYMRDLRRARAALAKARSL